MAQSSMTPEEIRERRVNARRSAWLLGFLVLLIFAGSIAFKMGAG